MTESARTERRTSAHLAVLLIALLWFSSDAAAQKLSLNDSYTTVECVVYELPDDADRAAAVAYVTDVRDLFFEGKELIDATQLDDDALRRKLTGGFVLYTTPHATARLLRRCVGELPMKFDSESVSAAGVSVPTDEARLIFLGKHPFGEAAVPVYVGGTNKLIAGINDAFHGPRSYYLFQKLRVRAVGDYGSDFKIHPPSQSLSEAIEDIEQFYAGLERVHPDLLAKISADQYLQDRRELLERLTQLSEADPDGKIRRKDFAGLLYKAAASFGDGHTSVHWADRPTDARDRDIRYPDAVLEYRNGRFFIAASTDKSIESRELIAIDGSPVEQGLRSILERCSGETLPCRVDSFIYRQAPWWWLTEALGSREQLTFTLLDAEGTRSSVELPTLDEKAFGALEQRVQEARWKIDRTRKALSFFGTDVACFTYQAFRLSEDEEHRIDSIFESIQARGVKRLILDLRGNGGGNSAMADFIFSYIHDEPFRSFSKYRVKLSPDALARDAELQRYADLEGMVITKHIEETRAEKPSAFFVGTIMLLVDNGTFSSATAFAAMFRDYEIGEIVGYETGGVPSCFGDVFSLSLEHSGIDYGVSYKQFFPPHPRPGDDEHGVIPDVITNDELLETFADELDPVLAFAIERIRGE